MNKIFVYLPFLWLCDGCREREDMRLGSSLLDSAAVVDAVLHGPVHHLCADSQLGLQSQGLVVAVDGLVEALHQMQSEACHIMQFTQRYLNLRQIDSPLLA